jgi:hypothetical protein
LSIPAIWDSDEYSPSEACEVILTNQRLIGFYCKSFPREKLFLDAFDIIGVKNVIKRNKAYHPVFQEIVVSEGMHKVAIRAPRQKCETMYAALRTAIALHHGLNEQEEIEEASEVLPPAGTLPAPFYGREDIHVAFDTSPLAIVVLFVGGMVLELVGVILWSLTQSSQVGLPLCIAGFIAVSIAIVQARQRKKRISS